MAARTVKRSTWYNVTPTTKLIEELTDYAEHCRNASDLTMFSQAVAHIIYQQTVIEELRAEIQRLHSV
jgi:hypothetical protein